MSDVKDVWRLKTPHVLAALTRRYREFGDCEDAVQEALLAASVQWPADGVPANPRAWLIRVAQHRLIDQFRSDEARRRREEVEVRLGRTRTRGGARRATTASICCSCAVIRP